MSCDQSTWHIQQQGLAIRLLWAAKSNSNSLYFGGRSLTNDLKGIVHKYSFKNAYYQFTDSGTSSCPTWMPLMKTERGYNTDHERCVNRLLEGHVAKPISIRHFPSVVVTPGSFADHISEMFPQEIRFPGKSENLSLLYFPRNLRNLAAPGKPPSYKSEVRQRWACSSLGTWQLLCRSYKSKLACRESPSSMSETHLCRFGNSTPNYLWLHLLCLPDEIPLPSQTSEYSLCCMQRCWRELHLYPHDILGSSWTNASDLQLQDPLLLVPAAGDGLSSLCKLLTTCCIKSKCMWPLMLH